MKSRISIVFIAACATVLLLLGGCQEPPPEPSEAVTERAQKRWDALVARDFSAAWALYSPGFRETNPEGDFTWEMSRRPVRWEEARVAAAECDGDRCTASVRVRYHVPAAPAGLNTLRNERRVEETWIRVDDQWWYVPDS